MGARVTLKDTSVGCGTAAEVSDLNLLSRGNFALKTRLLFRAFLSHGCQVTLYHCDLINQ